MNLTIAHQYIAQIEEAGEMHGIRARLREAVFGNVGTILCGRIGPEDAEIMERVFTPTFDQHDLLNIDKFHASTVLSVDLAASKPFDMKLIPPKKGGDPRLAAAIRETSRSTYGRDKQLVNQEIIERMKLGKPVPRVPRRPFMRAKR